MTSNFGCFALLRVQSKRTLSVDADITCFVTPAPSASWLSPGLPLPWATLDDSRWSKVWCFPSQWRHLARDSQVRTLCRPKQLKHNSADFTNDLRSHSFLSPNLLHFQSACGSEQQAHDSRIGTSFLSVVVCAVFMPIFLPNWR